MLSKLPKPKIHIAHLRNLILSVFVLAIVFSIGYALGIKGFYVSLNSYPEVSISRELPKEKETLEFSLFWRVWDTLQSKYFDKDKLIPAKMVYGAIKGMVASVEDPYTIFLAPNENRVVQEDLKGNFEGVGIQIGFKGNQLAVVSPLTDSPAERAGIRAGDFIAAIKDEQKNLDRGTIGITLPEAVQAIRGPAGSTVTLTLLREGSEK
jgi:carboxyl-terminal processing protease